MFGFGNNYSKNRIQKWSDKGNIVKLLYVLEKGKSQSKIWAIEALVVHNFMNVKRVLATTLEIDDKDVALKAAQAIEHMGANVEEQQQIQAVRKKWQ